MPTNKEKLKSLRQKIDAIDNSIHELILKRTRVVEEVRLVKQGEKIKIRPAREAEILYRLIARHKGPFPKQELARIWRELIVATLRFEGPFSIAVKVNKSETGYRDLARDQYGSFAPMVQHTSNQEIIKAVSTQEVTVGVLPLPRAEDTSFWWPLLVSKDYTTVRVMARLPFIPDDNSHSSKNLNALVISTVPLEETGRDRTYLCFEAKEDTSFHLIKEIITKLGFPIVFKQEFSVSKKTNNLMFLTEVEGFIDEKGKQLEYIKNDLAKSYIGVSHLGGYATPLDPVEIKNNLNKNPKKREIL